MQTLSRFGEANHEFTYIYRGEICDRIVMKLQHGRLITSVDLYAPRDGEEWDVDRWQELMVHLESPATRESYLDAWRVARGLLAGRRVILGTGEVLQCEVRP